MNKIVLPKKSIILLMFITATLFASMKVIAAFIYENLLNSIVSDKLSEISLHVLIAFVCIVVSAISSYFYFYLKQKTQQQTINKLQESQFYLKEQQNLESWESINKGEFSLLLTNDCKNLSQLFTTTEMGVFLGAMQFILALFYGLSKSPLFSLFILGMSFLSFLLPKLLIPLIKKKYEHQQTQHASVRNVSSEMLKNMAMLKSFKAFPFCGDKFDKLYHQYANSSIKSVSLQYLMFSLSVGIGFLINAIWISVGIYFVSQSRLSIGVLIGFITLSNNFNWPFFEFSELLGSFATQKASYVRLFDGDNQLNNETTVCFNEPIKMQSMNEVIWCKDVSFTYKNHNKPVIDGVNMRIQAGEFVLLSGESGKGKSTLLKLMAGLYEPTKGSFQLASNGQIYTGKEIQEVVSYVPQRNMLFTMTIKENLLLGNDKASQQNIDDALKLSSAYDFVMSLPDQLNTTIGSHSEIQLSEGQSQRLSLARAFLKGSSIYILDEFSSAVDFANESEMVKALKKINATIVFTSHKHESRVHVDRIVSL